MNDGKTAVQADGGGKNKGAADGVNDADKRRGSGQGDPYPNPHSGKKPKDGFLGHGGQTSIEDRSRSGDNLD